MKKNIFACALLSIFICGTSAYAKEFLVCGKNYADESWPVGPVFGNIKKIKESGKRSFSDSAITFGREIAFDNENNIVSVLNDSGVKDQYTWQDGKLISKKHDQGDLTYSYHFTYNDTGTIYKIEEIRRYKIVEATRVKNQKPKYASEKNVTYVMQKAFSNNIQDFCVMTSSKLAKVVSYDLEGRVAAEVSPWFDSWTEVKSEEDAYKLLVEMSQVKLEGCNYRGKWGRLYEYPSLGDRYNVAIGICSPLGRIPYELFTYNKAKNLLTDLKSEKENFHYQYTFDDQGNWIKRVRLEPVFEGMQAQQKYTMKEVETITRSITYLP